MGLVAGHFPTGRHFNHTERAFNSTCSVCPRRGSQETTFSQKNLFRDELRLAWLATIDEDVGENQTNTIGSRGRPKSSEATGPPHNYPPSITPRSLSTVSVSVRRVAFLSRVDSDWPSRCKAWEKYSRDFASSPKRAWHIAK